VKIFLILSRRAALVGAAERVELTAPALAWMPGGHGQALRLEAGGRAHFLAVGSDVLAGAISGMPGAGRLRRLLGGTATVPSSRLGPFAAEVGQSFEVLTRETKAPGEGTLGIVSAHLALLCFHVWRLSDGEKRHERAATERAGSVAQRFTRLVDLHLRDGWTIKRYADALGVTEDRLHAASMRSHGRPPGALVRERLVAEVCSELQSSDLPVEQIAFALGFRDPGYFSRFCRKHLGTPPGRYRRDARASRSHALPGSYAAWP
jgi:AraC-like DNA-binding protein